MASESELLPGAVFAGDFEIVEPLGAGGMGALYVVRQRSTGALRALKLMQRDLVRSAALREKFEQEARIGARIESDHVAQVLAAGVDGATGMPWIAMELLRGETLAARVEKIGALPWAEVEAIFGQMCHALGAAHRQSIVHRDLKPENVFLATPRVVGVDLMVKLLDFGIAKVIAESTSTQTGVMGTPTYMAPEQYQGRGIGPHTDVWALGLIAFHLLTGKTYWKSATESTSGPASLMYEVCMEELVPASKRAAEMGSADRLPAGFDAWFARCVAREPAQRFADADAALAGMRSLIGKGAAPVAPFGGTMPLAPKGSATIPLAPADAVWGGTVPMDAAPADALPADVPPDAAPAPKRPRAKKTSPKPLVPKYEPPAPKKPAPSDRSGLGIVAGLGALMLAALGFAVFASRGPSSTGAEAAAERAGAAVAAWSDEASPIPVSSRDPVWGSRAAPVTLVIFSDFQCPFCARVESTFTELKEKYGKDKLRIVWKNNPLPFHQNAKPAAIAAEAVFRLGGSEAFWKFHALAFGHQKELNEDSYESWAAQAGVDRAAFRKLVADPDVAGKIEVDLAAGKAAGVTGTPASLINGVLLSGAQPLDQFTRVIDEQLVAARVAISDGTPAEGVYVKLSTQNKAAEPAAKKGPEPSEEDDKVWTVPVGESPSRGNPLAPVTIVEFSDFQCPFCARVEPTLDEILRIYGDKVRIVWKNNPLSFHPNAEPAAELALEARAQKGDRGFWAAHELLFKNSTRLGSDDLPEHARTLGLDVGKVQAAIASKKYAATIAADQRLAGDVKASGTPTFFVNGRRLVGAQPLEKFKAAVDRALGVTMGAPPPYPRRE